MTVSIDTRYYMGVYSLVNLVLSVALSSAEIEATVNLRVEGYGFHRTMIYEIDMGNFPEEDCSIALHLLMPPALHVNVDDLADLQRLGKSLACSEGEMDVELFAERAKSQNVTICTQLKSSKSMLALAVHERYQFARESGGYVNVTLPKPKLLLGCKDRIKEYRVSKIDLCWPCVDLSLKWREIPYKMGTGEYVWQVPVGDLSQLDQVTYVTLLFTCLGAVFIVKTILQPQGKGTKKN